MLSAFSQCWHAPGAPAPCGVWRVACAASGSPSIDADIGGPVGYKTRTLVDADVQRAAMVVVAYNLHGRVVVVDAIRRFARGWFRAPR